MPLTLADQGIRISVMTTKPAAFPVVTTAEATAGVRAECKILKSSYKLGSTGNKKIPDLAVCDPAGSEINGAPTYEGLVTPFIYLDADGKPVVMENDVWDLFAAAGTELWILESEGAPDSAAFATGQRYDVYHVTTATPTKPDDRYAGYVKRNVALTIKKGEEGLVFA